MYESIYIKPTEHSEYKSLLKDRMGDLLIALGVVEENDVNRGLILSEYTGLPLGTCLSLLQCIDPQLLKTVLEAQTLVRLNLMTIDQVVKALSIMHRNDWTLVDALISIGVDAHPLRGTRLGELLQSAGHIDEEHLKFALNLSDRSGLSLGKVLTMLCSTTPENLEKILEIQSEIRVGAINKKEAVDSLQSLKTDGNQVAYHSDNVRLQDLYRKSNLSETDPLFLLRVGFDMSGYIDWQELVNKKLLKMDTLVNSLRILEQVWQNQITLEYGATVLSRIIATNSGVNLESAALQKEVSKAAPKISFARFLRMSGYLNSYRTKEVVDGIISNIEITRSVCSYSNLKLDKNLTMESFNQAVKNCFRNDEKLYEVLCEIKNDEWQIITCAYVMYKLIKEGKMRLEQALICLGLKTFAGRRKSGYASSFAAG